LSLVIAGLFLALGIQSIIQFVEVIVPHISAYYYLGLGIGSLLLVLVFFNRAVKYAGLYDQFKQDKTVSEQNEAHSTKGSLLNESVNEKNST
jgi:hypothetical protein